MPAGESLAAPEPLSHPTSSGPDGDLGAALTRLQAIAEIAAPYSASVGARSPHEAGRCTQDGPAPGALVQVLSSTTGSTVSKTQLTYQIDPLPTGADTADVVGGINQALAAWSTVTPIRFDQIPSGADLRFRFDGMLQQPDGTLQSIQVPTPSVAGLGFGQISFASGTLFSSQDPLPSGATDIVSVASHELGHFLGLGHSTNPEAIMYPVYGWPSDGSRALSADDIEAVQSLYGAPAIPVPGFFGDVTSGADIAVANLQAQSPVEPKRMDVLVAHVDNAFGPNTGYYRVGWDVDANGVPRAGWGPITALGSPIQVETQGLALAVGHIGGSVTNGLPRPDLVVVWVDHVLGGPLGASQARYRIGFDLDTSGMNGTWGPDIAIPGLWGDTGGLAAAVADLNGSGQPDLVVAWIDELPGENLLHYKIGFDLDANGNAAVWSPQLEAGTVGHLSGGLGIAATDLRGNGRPDLVLFWVDNPRGRERGRHSSRTGPGSGRRPDERVRQGPPRARPVG